MKRAWPLALALWLAPLWWAGAAAAAPRAEDGRALRVTGEVLSASVVEAPGSEHSVRVVLKIRLRFFNAGGRALLLLDREPWPNSEALALSREDAAAGRFVYESVHLPSIYRAPGNEWERLTRQLDRGRPPSGLTRVLPPGGAWEFDWDYWWTMSKESYDYGKEVKGWNELRRSPTLWLTFSFGMWPSNVEPDVRRSDRREFGHRLRRRWREFGDLWLDVVGSEPMELKLGGAVERRGSHLRFTRGTKS